MTTHASYAFMIRALSQAVNASDRDSNLQFLPLAHAFGRLEHLAGYERGFETWFAENLDTVAQDLLVAGPTIVYGVPRVFEKIYSRVMGSVEASSPLRRKVFRWSLGVGRRASRASQAGNALAPGLRVARAIADRLVFSTLKARVGGRIRFFVSGGAPLAREIAEFFHAAGILILEGYGMTETSTASHINRYDRFKFGTVGPPLPGVEQKIAEDGEILLRGPNIFQGYHRDPAATEEALDREGWLHTGDIGEIDEEGFLRITDRKKDLIVTAGGKNVAPQNVENLLKTDPYISQAMVHGDRRKFCSAVIVLNHEAVMRWAERAGLAEREFASLAAHPKVRDLLQRSIDEKNKQLAPYEQIK
ncbi:MAG: AMP-dependent synthetase/ligase, partial [Vicinamibacteria bacterium]